MLEPSADEIRDWGNSVTQFMIEYLGGLRDHPVYRHTSSREIRSGLDSKLPIKGTDFATLLKVFRDTKRANQEIQESRNYCRDVCVKRVASRRDALQFPLTQRTLKQRERTNGLADYVRD